MSLPAIVWVFKHSPATQGARLVLLALAEFAHDDGSKAFPTVATIGDRTRLSERQVQYALRKLEDSGEIVRTGKTKAGVNIYTVVMGGAETAGAQSETARGAILDTFEVQPTAPDPRTEPLEDPRAAAPQKKQQVREPDEIWDALEQIFGPVTNENSRGKRNKAVALLKQSDATPTGIDVRARRYTAMYPDAALTDMALANQWDNLGLVMPRVEEQAGVRAMEEREAAERKAEAEDAVPPEEAARRAQALLDQLRGNT